MLKFLLLYIFVTLSTMALYSDEAPSGETFPTALKQDQEILKEEPIHPQPDNTWMYTRDVIYEDDHDQAQIVLSGDALSVDSRLYYADQESPFIRYLDVADWEQGRKLTIAYNPETGAVIYDRQSGKYIEVYLPRGAHPIESLLDQWREDAVSTVEIVNAMTRAINLWEIEIERCLKKLKERLPESEEGKIENSYREWNAYYLAQKELIVSVYSQQQGTIRSILASSDVKSLATDYARFLQSLTNF